MKKKILSAVLVGMCAGPAFAGDVGVSISLGQPGFFGRIDIGNVPQPQVVYAQPVVVQQAPEFVSAPPIYLHVPPGHEKHWSKHCAEYNACGRPVYFVRDDWYNREYVPRYRDGGRHDEGEGHRDAGHGERHDHDEGHDHGERHDRGEGHDKDHGHDEGHDH